MAACIEPRIKRIDEYLLIYVLTVDIWISKHSSIRLICGIKKMLIWYQIDTNFMSNWYLPLNITLPDDKSSPYFSRHLPYKIEHL